jgi:hypothetical protein
MQLKNVKLVIASTYVVAVVGAGFASGLASPSGWTAVVALAFLPAAALLRLWNDPTPTMSERIQRARR